MTATGTPATTGGTPSVTATQSPSTITSPSATPTTGVTCTGDCDEQGDVEAGELVSGVSIGLGEQDSSACGAFDVNRDGAVTVDELVRGVTYAREGCPA